MFYIFYVIFVYFFEYYLQLLYATMYYQSISIPFLSNLSVFTHRKGAITQKILCTRIKPVHRILYVSNHCRYLFIHLSCNFSCEIFMLLLKTFTCFKTNKVLNLDICSISLSYSVNILLNGLLAIFGLNIYLLK